MLLGPIPPKLDRQHEKTWALLTFPTYMRLIFSLQSHTHLTQPSVPPVPSPLSTSSLTPPSDDTRFQVCQSPFDEHQMFLCDKCNAGWTAFSHPLPLFHMDSGSAPYVSHSTCFPNPQLSTFAFLPPSSISTLIKMLPNKMTTCPYVALPDYPLPQNKGKKKIQTLLASGPIPQPKPCLSFHKPFLETTYVER